MGILNVTDDSFYANSRTSSQQIVDKAGQMLEDGATILDIGGQSTRPGAPEVAETIEIERTIESISKIKSAFPTSNISIDTYKGSVAKLAIDAGACMINDISAGKIDPEIIQVAAKQKVPYVLMHMQGKPATMQKKPSYKNVVQEVFDFLSFESHALLKSGLVDVILDPGFGFGKTTDQNYQLINSLDHLSKIGFPVLAGVSRKSMIWKVLESSPEDALFGTIAAQTVALLKKVAILRVHDVKAASDSIKIINQLGNI